MVVGVLRRHMHALVTCVQAQHRVSLREQFEDDGFFTRWGVGHDLSPWPTPKPAAIAFPDVSMVRNLTAPWGNVKPITRLGLDVRVSLVLVERRERYVGVPDPAAAL